MGDRGETERQGRDRDGEIKQREIRERPGDRGEIEMGK